MQQIRKLISLVIFLFPVFLFSQEFIGFVNDDFVRLREEPGLEGNVVAVLSKGEKIKITGRTETRDFISGNNSHWLEVFYQNQTAWIYAAFVNLEKKRYQDIPIKKKENEKNFTDVSNSNFSSAQEWVKKEKEIIERYYKTSRIYSIQSLYENFVSLIKAKQNVQSLFLNTLELAIVETSRFTLLSSALFTDFLQENSKASLKISPLFMQDNYTGVFWITGFDNNTSFIIDETCTIGIVFHMIRVSDFDVLESRIVIDSVILSPYEPSMFPSETAHIQFLFSPYTLGISDLLRALTNKEFAEESFSFDNY